MENCVKVSVIIPVYNSEKYIQRCLNSVLNQTLQEIEIICVNDGSTDNSLNILNNSASKDSRIKVFSIQNSGPGIARNVGIKEAKGTFLFFCDSDDEISFDGLSNLYQEIGRSSCDVVSGNYVESTSWSGDKTISFANLKTPEELLLDKIMIWNKLYRREYIIANRIAFPASSQAEDRVFIAYVYANNPVIRICNKTVYTWYRYPMSETKTLTRQYNFRSFRQKLENWEIFWNVSYPKSGQKGRELFFTNLGYLRDQCKFIRSKTEQAQAFCLLQRFLKKIDWSDSYSTDFFKKLFSCTPDEFWDHTYESFFPNNASKPEGISPVECKEVVLQQFINGEIGFKYILRCFKGWMTFKIRRRK